MESKYEVSPRVLREAAMKEQVELERELSYKGLKTLTPEQIMTKKLRISDLKHQVKRLSNVIKADEAAEAKKKSSESDAGKLRRVLRDPQVWLRGFCERHRVDIHNDGMMFDGVAEKHLSFESLALLEYTRNVDDYNDMAKITGDERVEPARSDRFRASLQLMYRDIKRAHLVEACKKTSYDPAQDDSELRSWCRLTFGNDNSLYLNIIKHAMQNVKRKMRGLKVEHHIFPILVGQQEDGKTEALRKLMEAISEFTLEFMVDQLADTTLIGSFEENYAIICDEMARADKAEISILKRVVSGDKLSGRPPYGTHVESVKQNCGMFGTSNESVRRMINDRQMRRFAELRSKARTPAQYPEMDALVSLKMWRCIDENDINCYFNESRSEIKLHQAELCTQEPSQIWAEEFEVVPMEGTKIKYASASQLFGHWERWMQHNNYQYTTNKNSFGHWLQDIGISCAGQVDVGRGKERRRVVLYKINEGHLLNFETDLDIDRYNHENRNALL